MASEDGKKTCFVIGPIGKPGTDKRTRADQLFKHVIAPICDGLGYSAKRADHLSQPGMITNQIIRFVMESDLVIADLTEANPNVFYELALRHALCKPVVHLVNDVRTLPFDLRNVRVIEVILNDLDKLENAMAELADQIGAAEAPDHVPENPISIGSGVSLVIARKDKGREEIDIDKHYGISDEDGHFFTSIRLPPSSEYRTKFFDGTFKNWQRLSLEHGVDCELEKGFLNIVETLLDELARVKKQLNGKGV